MSTGTPRILAAVLYPGFELLDLYGPLEMFGTLTQDYRIVTVAEQPGAVASAQGPATVAEFDFANAPTANLVLLPGGIGTLPALTNTALLEYLRRAAAQACGDRALAATGQASDTAHGRVRRAVHDALGLRGSRCRGWFIDGGSRPLWPSGRVMRPRDRSARKRPQAIRSIKPGRRCDTWLRGRLPLRTRRTALRACGPCGPIRACAAGRRTGQRARR